MTRKEASKKLPLIRAAATLALLGLCSTPILRSLVILTGPIPQPLSYPTAFAVLIVIGLLADAAVTELVLFLDGKKSEAAVDPDENVNQPTA